MKRCIVILIFLSACPLAFASILLTSECISFFPNFMGGSKDSRFVRRGVGLGQSVRHTGESNNENHSLDMI